MWLDETNIIFFVLLNQGTWNQNSEAYKNWTSFS